MESYRWHYTNSHHPCLSHPVSGFVVSSVSVATILAVSVSRVCIRCVFIIFRTRVVSILSATSNYHIREHSG
ncbi:hypothetical protein BD410DRAFT_552028 [Rickenella mellea]|uniref:Uncharacterized protein n=1 Tax=Rickenella mellea TaxID=50990 RepID=A0A4Y7PR56_9AGAM|nr:hypothetical protein BD410DRAFT_552028 [Rickenella mellea]